MNVDFYTQEGDRFSVIHPPDTGWKEVPNVGDQVTIKPLDGDTEYGHYMVTSKLWRSPKYVSLRVRLVYVFTIDEARDFDLVAGIDERLSR